MGEAYGWGKDAQGLILSAFFLGYLLTQLLGGARLWLRRCALPLTRWGRECCAPSSWATCSRSCWAARAAGQRACVGGASRCLCARWGRGRCPPSSWATLLAQLLGGCWEGCREAASRGWLWSCARAGVPGLGPGSSAGGQLLLPAVGACRHRVRCPPPCCAASAAAWSAPRCPCSRPAHTLPRRCIPAACLRLPLQERWLTGTAARVCWQPAWWRGASPPCSPRPRRRWASLHSLACGALPPEPPSLSWACVKLTGPVQRVLLPARPSTCAAPGSSRAPGRPACPAAARFACGIAMGLGEGTSLPAIRSATHPLPAAALLRPPAASPGGWARAWPSRPSTPPSRAPCRRSSSRRRWAW